MTLLPWVALGVLLGAIVSVALVVWLASRFGDRFVTLLTHWLDDK